MRILLLILLLPCMVNAQKFHVTYDDPTLCKCLVGVFQYGIESFDKTKRGYIRFDSMFKTTDTLLYKDNLFYFKGGRINYYDLHLSDIVKYDTIGLIWRIVSDTSHNAVLPALSMQLYEVIQRIHKYRLDEGLVNSYKHIKWLDINKQPLNLKVWEDYK